MFNNKLEKRLKNLEEFLGITYSEDSLGYGDYTFKVAGYGDMKPYGILGELKADLVKRQEAEQLTKKGKE